MPVKKTRKTRSTPDRSVGAGVGVVGGAAAGAAIGSFAGPAGTAIGAMVGGVIGAAGGEEVAETIDPVAEERYWATEYTNRPYYQENLKFEEYRPAYRYGLDAVSKYPGKRYDDVESRLSRNWSKSRGDSSLAWGQAKEAVRDAYDRTLQLHEERLKVDKEKVRSGEVALCKEVKTTKQSVTVPVEREEVVVTRRRVNSKTPKGTIQADEIRIPVSEERVKVRKETVPVEEVSVGRRKVQTNERVDATVRKEQLKVEDKGNKVRVTGNGRNR